MTALNMEQRLLGRYHLDHELCAEIRRLIAENKRYRTALEFYADPTAWSESLWVSDGVTRAPIVRDDIEATRDGRSINYTAGKRAREALGGEGVSR